MRRTLLVGLVAVTAAGAAACGDDGGGSGSDDAAYAAACGEGTTDGDAAARAVAVALPPEEVSGLLPQADAVVDAEVTEILYEGADTGEEPDPDVAGPIPDERCQVVVLDVGEALLGSEEGEIEVVKPQNPYLLDVDEEGVFFLAGTDEFPDILGIYGPADYTVDEVEAEIAKEQ